MADKNEAQLLVALQDLEEMIREAEDPAQRAKLESMGLPVTGIEELRKALQALEGQISPAMIGRYRRLRQRTGRAIVPVVSGACTGCFANIPSSFTSSVHHGKVVNCESCGRMLYWP
jgi:predicted  nucleic acid-binding Zn-ribbon protein